MIKGFTLICLNCGEKIILYNGYWYNGNINNKINVYTTYDPSAIIECKNCGLKIEFN